MIERLEISGLHIKVDDDLKKYVTKKIGKLDTYLPRRARASAHAEVKLSEQMIKTKKLCSCEVVLRLPHDTLTTKETTVNMFAAVDIVEAKLKNQIKKYKETHSSLKLHRRILGRIRRRG
ncbi:MAG: hypothetical protein JWS12_151 [Candidatus Saccharibacteria bacterium]|nr:hypothetical protein [Candidatus Saccharibacteria bacterium]